jgi:hypothetical protein
MGYQNHNFEYPGFSTEICKWCEMCPLAVGMRQDTDVGQKADATMLLDERNFVC